MFYIYLVEILIEFPLSKYLNDDCSDRSSGRCRY